MAGTFYTCISDCKFHKLQWLSYDTKCVDFNKIFKRFICEFDKNINTWEVNLISWISYPNIFKQWLLKSSITLSLCLCTHQVNELSIMILMNCDQWSWLLELYTTINELNDSGLRLRIIEFNYLWLAINEFMTWIIKFNGLNCLSLWLNYNQ